MLIFGSEYIPIIERLTEPGCGTYRLHCRCGCIDFDHVTNMLCPAFIHGLKILRCRYCKRKVAVPYTAHPTPENQ